jgi:hypothetical protein
MIAPASIVSARRTAISAHVRSRGMFMSPPLRFGRQSDLSY